MFPGLLTACIIMSREPIRDSALVNLAYLTSHPHSAGTLRAEGFLPALFSTLATLSLEQSLRWDILRHASIAMRNFLAADSEHIFDFLSLNAAGQTATSTLLSLLSSVSTHSIDAGDLREIQESLADILDRICSVEGGRIAALQCPYLPQILASLLRVREASSSIASSALSAVEYLSREQLFLESFHSSGNIISVLSMVMFSVSNMLRARPCRAAGHSRR